MTKREEDEHLLLSELELLEKQYREEELERSPNTLDKRVLRQADTAIKEKENAGQREQRWHFWRRLELPMYALSVLAATAVAMQWFLPDVAFHKAQTSSDKATEIEIISENKPSQPQRVQRKMPELELPLPLPLSSRQRSMPKPVETLPEQNIDTGAVEFKGQIQLESSDLSKNIQHQVPSLLDQKQWLARIKYLITSGRMSEARQEISKFKSVYPDYPIDEELAIIR